MTDHPRQTKTSATFLSFPLFGYGGAYGFDLAVHQDQSQVRRSSSSPAQAPPRLISPLHRTDPPYPFISPFHVHILRVSSVLNRNVKDFGAVHLFDGSPDTCWNSDQVKVSAFKEHLVLHGLSMLRPLSRSPKCFSMPCLLVCLAPALSTAAPPSWVSRLPSHPPDTLILLQSLLHHARPTTGLAAMGLAAVSATRAHPYPPNYVPGWLCCGRNASGRDISHPSSSSSSSSSLLRPTIYIIRRRNCRSTPQNESSLRPCHWLFPE